MAPSAVTPRAKMTRVQTHRAQMPGAESGPNRRDLHWLPVGHLITYKLCVTTWKTLHTSQPLYLSELYSHYLPSRSNTNLLTRPTFPLGPFLCLHLLLGTLYLHTFVLLTPYPHLNAT